MFAIDHPNVNGAVSKADYAYSSIRRKILDGEFEPGARLVIVQIARDIDVSVVPVREAVRRLEAEGFIVYTRNVGATVASVDLSRYPETVETQAILEGAATGLAAPFLRLADIKKARRINLNLQRYLEANDHRQFAVGNKNFHNTLFEPCPNRHLYEMVLKEWDLLETTRRAAFSFVPERAMESIGEHEALLQLIEGSPDPKPVEAFAREHRLRTVRYQIGRAHV